MPKSEISGDVSEFHLSQKRKNDHIICTLINSFIKHIFTDYLPHPDHKVEFS